MAMRRPKEIYFNYLGSKFGMLRDGTLEEYESFSITKDEEASWREELIDYWKRKLSPTKNIPVINLSIITATEALPEILALAETGDSHFKMICANALWNIATRGDKSKTDQDTIRKSKKMAIHIWKNIEQGEIQLSKDPGLKAWPEKPPEQALRAWAIEQLKKSII